MALEYKSQHVSDEKKNATSVSENITVRRFITSGSLHYFSKARDYSTEPLQWSSSKGPFTYRVFCALKFVISNVDARYARS